LYRDSEASFDLSSMALNNFLNKLEHRGKTSGWGLVNIVTDAVAGTTCNLITRYGEVTLAQVRTHVQVYDATYTIQVQHDEQLYSCLMASLSPEATNLISLKLRDYKTLSGENSGLLLLRLIITESTLETKSTINNMWGKLTSGMPAIMASHGNDIFKFNTSVRAIQVNLRARGQDPEAIVPQLFQVYASCEPDDSPFSRYIEYVENQFNEGTDMDAVDLMSKAEEKYKELVDRQLFKSAKGGTNDLVVLQTKLDAMTEKLKTATTGPSGQNGGQSGGGTGRDRNPNGDRKQAQWMFQKPKDGESKSKLMNGKDYYWCDGSADSHKPKWVRHKPAECKGQTGGSSGGSSNPPASGDAPPSSASSATATRENVGWSAAMLGTLHDNDE
jgi:hypothetical protein